MHGDVNAGAALEHDNADELNTTGTLQHMKDHEGNLTEDIISDDGSDSYSDQLEQCRGLLAALREIDSKMDARGKVLDEMAQQNSETLAILGLHRSLDVADADVNKSTVKVDKVRMQRFDNNG